MRRRLCRRPPRSLPVPRICSGPRAISGNRPRGARHRSGVCRRRREHRTGAAARPGGGDERRWRRGSEGKWRCVGAREKGEKATKKQRKRAKRGQWRVYDVTQVTYEIIIRLRDTPPLVRVARCTRATAGFSPFHHITFTVLAARARARAAPACFLCLRFSPVPSHRSVVSPCVFFFVRFLCTSRIRQSRRDHHRRSLFLARARGSLRDAIRAMTPSTFLSFLSFA